MKMKKIASAQVSSEFRGLEVKLLTAVALSKTSPSPQNMQNVKQIEKNIQNRYAHFEKDPEFMKVSFFSLFFKKFLIIN